MQLVAACADGNSPCQYGMFFRDCLHGLWNGVLRPRLRVWDLSDGRAAPTESAPDREGLHLLWADIASKSTALLTSEGERRIAWRVLGGRLHRQAHLDLGGGHTWTYKVRGSPDGRAFIDVVAQEERAKKEGVDQGVSYRGHPGSELKVFGGHTWKSLSSSVRYGYPVTLSLIDRSSGQGLKVAETDRYLFESGMLGWSLESTPLLWTVGVFAPDGKGAAWCLDNKRVHVWDLRGEVFRKHCLLSVEEEEEEE